MKVNKNLNMKRYVGKENTCIEAHSRCADMKLIPLQYQYHQRVVLPPHYCATPLQLGDFITYLHGQYLAESY